MLSWIASCCHGSPKKGPIGEEAGVMSCRPAMLRGCKAGLFIHPVSLSLHFCSSTAYYKREKEYHYTTMQGYKQKKAQKQEKTSEYRSYGPFQILPVIVLAFSWSKRICFKSQAFYTRQPSNSIPRNLPERIKQMHKDVNTWIFIVTLLLKNKK